MERKYDIVDLIAASVTTGVVVIMLVIFVIVKNNEPEKAESVNDTTKIVIIEYERKIDSLNIEKRYEIEKLNNMSDSDAVRLFYKLLSD